MSNSSSRSVWSFIIKVIITVATAVGGLIGVQSLYVNLCGPSH
ncbi:smalltalk protein [Bacteroides thetaiotaomicron]|nr:smalltalk protein [Bacteroides thetaiotaomicron]